MKTSHGIAIGLTGLIVLWIGSGMLLGHAAPTEQTSHSESAAAEMVVETTVQKAEPVVSFIIAQGHIMPDREVTLRAETAAQISEILIKEGNAVKEGDILARLNMNDRQIQLEKAQAKTAEERRKYTSAKSLGEKGYTATARIDETLAALRSAQAEEKQIALEIENTNIKAPFDGIIDRQHIEKGDYVNISDETYTIVDNDPLVVGVYIPQGDIDAIETGGTADILLATGQNKQGKIRFIAPRAEQTTRTFRVDIEMPNPENLPSGTSATVRIPKKSVMAHFVSPSLLALDEQSATGVKIVNDKNIVEFFPVKIVSAQPDGIYVNGLPDLARIILNGQGFVTAGEKVSYVDATAKAGEQNENH